MSPARRRLVLLGFVCLFGLGVLLFVSREDATTSGARSEQSVAHGQPTPSTNAPIAENRVVEIPQIGPSVSERVLLERPSPSAWDAGTARSVVQLAEEAAGPIDRRANPGPRAKQELEIVRYAFETLDEDIRSCLEQWDAVEPGQAGEVMIALEIDHDGLRRSWLEHDAGVPFGPRTCIANAVYGLDWSKIVDHPAKLTNRFELGRADGRR